MFETMLQFYKDTLASPTEKSANLSTEGNADSQDSTADVEMKDGE